MPSKIQMFQEKLKEFPDYIRDWSKTFKGGLTIACLLGLIFFPFLTSNAYYLGIFILAMVFAIYAASWDFLAGFTGKVSFGHAIFLGISGYMVSYLLVFLNFTWWIAILMGVIVACLFGLFIGSITLRLKGPYLALGTMVFGIIMQRIFALHQLKPILFGDEGISGVPTFSDNIVVIYYVYLIFMVFSLIIMLKITKLNVGIIFRSIRDDETGAEASGINTTRYKIGAFMISSLFAGLAGALLALYNGSINPLIFQPLYSFYALVMAAMGGLATIVGATLGAFIFIFLGEIVRDLADPLFIFSIILIIIIRFASEGILNDAIEKIKDFWDLLLGR
jgi:branched-chain amino acid transport system permease protein